MYSLKVSQRKILDAPMIVVILNSDTM